MSADEWKSIRVGDIVRIMSPGKKSGKLGITISQLERHVSKPFGSDPAPIVKRQAWYVLVDREIGCYVDYLLWPITYDDIFSDEIVHLGTR